MKKLLRNRFVVAGLVVVALASVFFSARKELRRALGSRWAAFPKQVSPPLPAENPPTVAMPAPSSTNSTPNRGTTIRREIARSRQARWVEAPERDPFAIFAGVAVTRPDPKKALAIQVSAIWRQSGQQLAVINGRVVKEGDQAFDHTVERIESSAVFLRNAANAVARAEFPAFSEFAHTNRVAAAAVRAAEADRRKTVEPGG